MGSAVVTPDPGSGRPIGTALFSYTNSENVLVSQAGVEAVEPIRKGRFFVDDLESRTGFALVNPGTVSAAATLILRDASGHELDRKTQTLEPGNHLARFVDEVFPTRPAGMQGSLTFESDQPLAAITLRQTQNRFGEVLYATLPVVDLNAAPNADPVVFPHIAVGDGFDTQLLLINRSTQKLTGRVRFWSSDGQPLLVRAADTTSAEIAYQIEADGVYRAQLDSPAGLNVGYAVVAPDPGTNSPAGTAVFQFRDQGRVVTEAAVAATLPTKRSRIFVDHAISRTGVAVANPGNTPAELTLVLMDRFGGIEGTTTQTIPAGGHLARFAHELFPGYLTEGFNGLLEIQSSTPVFPITLKLTPNSRNETVLTTLPVANLERPPGTTPVIFPQIAIGAGFSTRLIFITTDSASAQTGGLAFFHDDASPMILPVPGQVPGRYQFPRGSGSQLYPGNTAAVSSLQVVDPSADVPTSEVAVNVGGTVRPRIQIRDSNGDFRADFDVSVQSLDSSIASVDNGNVHGEQQGFTTLTLSSGSVVITATATVVGVNSGAPGFGVTGIAQDRASRLYLAAATQNAVLLAQSVSQAPSTYAGIPKSPGLLDGPRLSSQFRTPSFLVLNQQNGDLYVSDGINHAIRRVTPGTPGSVKTLAGAGAAGSQNGACTSATFNNPQGIALDRRGNLWVADSGSHVIRRINLATCTVETVAGLAGTPGFADGSGQAARFRSVAGLAVVTETAEQEIERVRRNQPPPPVQVLVADSGNNAIRLVTEDGLVETLNSTNAGASRADASKGVLVQAATLASRPLSFNAPTGVAMDPFGNIFVSEAGSGQLRTILQTGEVVPAAQRNTFTTPGGIAITQKGSVVVADGNRAAQEIVFGEPQITRVAPEQVSDQGGKTITITGKNFAPDSQVFISGVRIPSVNVLNTQVISFTTVPLPSGLTTLTVQNRGGLAQTSILLTPVSLNSLTQGQITTVAGGTTFIGDGSPALTASLNNPGGAAIDAAGNIFFADTNNHRVRKLNASTGIISTVAGSGAFDFSGDGGPAVSAAMKYPVGVAVDVAGNLFIADGDVHRVRKVSAVTGIISTVATLDYPVGVAVDGAGNLFISDTNTHLVSKVAGATGIITTVAGTGNENFSGDNGPATAADLDYPSAVALDAAGNLFIADTRNYRVRKVDAGSGVITTVAGAGGELTYPIAIAIDGAGSLYISDRDDQRVRKVTPDGIISTVAGTGTKSFSGDGGQAAAASLNSPRGVAVDAAGNIFVSDSANDRVRKVTATTGVIDTVAGSGIQGQTGEGGPATAASFSLAGIVVDRTGNLFIAADRRVLKVAADNGIISTVAGNGNIDSSGDGGLATNASIGFPIGLAVDTGGNLFITANREVRKVAAVANIIYTIVATYASFNFPAGIAVNDAGDLFIADVYNDRVRKMTAATGGISTVAGTGDEGISGDNGPATAASLHYPLGVALDIEGNLFFADNGNNRVRKVTTATGFISTIASGLNDPKGIAVDGAGNLFIADSDNHRVLKVTAATGVISTVAGTGAPGLSGDGGAATSAQLANPEWIAIDSAGNLYIADTDNHRVRVVRGVAVPRP